MIPNPAISAHPTVVDPTRIKWKNIGYAFAVLLLWVAARFCYARLGGKPGGFLQYDVLFIVLPTVGTFFLNWYWLREEHMDMLIRWAVAWGVIDLLLFGTAIVLLGALLHQWILQLFNTGM